MIKAIVERDQIDYLRFLSDLANELGISALAIRQFLTTRPPKTKKVLGGPLLGGFYSEKQRRFVMGGIRAGTIVVPYMRTGDLTRAWSVTPVQVTGNSMSVEVYNDPSLAPYARMVQDPAVRPEMHSDWPTPSGARQALEPAIVARLKEVGKRYGFG